MAWQWSLQVLATVETLGLRRLRCQGVGPLVAGEVALVLLDAVGICRAVQHKGVHRPGNVSVLFLSLFKSGVVARGKRSLVKIVPAAIIAPSSMVTALQI